MNSLVFSNETTIAAGYSDGQWQKDGHTSSGGSWMHAAPAETLVLSKIEHELIQEFAALDSVNALYAERDDEDVLMVFVVVPEHDDSVYQQVMDAEYRLRDRISDDFELRVRAHQGRNPTRAVPIRSLPLFRR